MTDNPYKFYQTDVDYVKEGIWVEEPTLRVRVRFAGEENRKYWADFMKTMTPFQGTLKKLEKQPQVLAAFDRKTVTPALAQLFVDHIILDWGVSDGIDEESGDFLWKEGMQNFQGDIVPYNRELAKQILLEVPRLFSRIREVAGDYAMFSGNSGVAEEETLKNSEKP